MDRLVGAWWDGIQAGGRRSWDSSTEGKQGRVGGGLETKPALAPQEPRAEETALFSCCGGWLSRVPSAPSFKTVKSNMILIP